MSLASLIKAYSSPQRREFVIQKLAGMQSLYSKQALKDKLDALGPDDFIKEFEKAVHLSKVNPEIAKIMSEEGDGKKDKIAVQKATIDANKLKPSQTTMVLSKSLGMALVMLERGKVGGDLGAIISSDGYIMDGHHRWSASILAGGSSAKVGGYQADLKGEELVRALNVLTKGHFKRMKGNPGKGTLSDYTVTKVRAAVKDLVENGISGDFPKTSRQVKKILEDNFGSVEKGIDTVASHAKLIKTSTPSWAPERNDMPVIKPGEVSDAAKKLQQGEIIIPPRSLKALAIRVAKIYSQRQVVV